MQGSLYSSSDTVTFQQTAHYHIKSELEVIELWAEFVFFLFLLYLNKHKWASNDALISSFSNSLQLLV